MLSEDSLPKPQWDGKEGNSLHKQNSHRFVKLTVFFSKWKHVFIIFLYIPSLPFNTQAPLWVCLLFLDSRTLYRVWAITEPCIKSSYVVNEHFNEHVLGKWKTDGLSVYISFIAFVNPELTSHVLSILFVSVCLQGSHKSFSVFSSLECFHQF